MCLSPVKGSGHVVFSRKIGSIRVFLHTLRDNAEKRAVVVKRMRAVGGVFPLFSLLDTSREEKGVLMTLTNDDCLFVC